MIGRDRAVVSVMRCALIMDVAAGRAYCAALRIDCFGAVPRLRAADV